MQKYFRYIHNKYVVSEDNWKNYTIETSVKSEAIVENDEDIKYKVKLEIDFGKDISKMIIYELEKIRFIYKRMGIEYKKDGYGTSLEVFAIAVLYNYEYEQVIQENIVIGSEDGKVDAVVFLKEKTKIYQIKNAIIPENVIEEARKNINSYLMRGNIGKKNTKDLLNYCKEHKRELRENSIEYWTISTNGTGNNISITDIYKMFFMNRVVYGPNPDNNLEFSFEITERNNDMGKKERNFADNGKVKFMFIPAKELIEQITCDLHDKESIEKIFGFNVRGFVGVNKPMIQTVENTPSKFCLFNNGVSIIGNVRINGSHIRVRNPYFVNGQQTVINLYLLNNGNYELSDIYVPVFFKDVNDVDDIVSIAKYNNTQKAIKLVDLLSLDSKIREIQKYIFNESYLKKDDAYYLKIYSSGKKENKKMIDKLYLKNNQIDLIDYLRLNACLYEPEKIGEWKNNPSKCLERYYIETPFTLDYSLAINICKSISYQYQLEKKEKSKYSYASVLLEYLYIKLSFDFEKSLKVIDEYNKIYYYSLDATKRPKNIADIYKSKETYKRTVDLINVMYGIEL